MTGSCLAQGGLLLGAPRHDKRASGVESAAAGRIEGRGEIALQHDALFAPFEIGIGDGHRRDERLGVRVARIAVDLFAVGEFGDAARKYLETEVLPHLDEIEHKKTVTVGGAEAGGVAVRTGVNVLVG